MIKILNYCLFGTLSVALSACMNGAPAPIVEGGIKQNWLGQGPRDEPTMAAQKQPEAMQTAQIPAAQPFSQPVAPLLQEEELNAVAPAAGPVPAARSGIVRHTATLPTVPAVAAVAPTHEPYTVQTQDTLYRIARAHNTTPQAIMATNNLRDMTDLQPGRIITIPTNVRPAAPSLAQSIKSYLETPPTPAGAPSMAAQTPAQPRETEVALAPAAQGYEIARIEPAAGHAPGVALTHNAKPALQHQVGAGETIFRISKNYGVSVLDIMAANDLAKPEALQAGTLVNIPPSATAELTTGTGAIRPVANKVGSALRPAAELGVTETTRATMTTPAAITGTDVRPAFDPDKGTDTADSVRPLRDVKPMTDTERMKAELKRGVIDKAAAAQRGLIWPARGAVVKRFGEKGNGVAYTGINIEVPVGTPVLATEDGIVLYAADGLRTYGQMVLLRHSNGMVSAYAHNSHLLVRKGEKVRKGQVVATSGQSGNAGSPQLHFELRRNAVALDPLRVLPKL